MVNKVEIVGDDSNSYEESDLLQSMFCFTSAIYTIKKLEYLNDMRYVCKEFIKKRKTQTTLDKIYPVIMTENLFEDEKIKPLLSYIIGTSKSILASQGYNMNMYDINCFELWCQEHYQYSGQEEHIHPHSQISGFYVLDVPENSPRIIFHDTNQAKKMLPLAETNYEQATFASTSINFVPEPGMFYFTNSWLPHSFTKNPSKKPFKFIHFNCAAIYNPKNNAVDTSNLEAQII